MKLDKKIKELELYAILNDVPITEEEGLQVIFEILANQPVKKILEIGTAIGYSALRFYQKFDAQIVTVERDEKRSEMAFAAFEEIEAITLIQSDALELDVKEIIDEYDFIYFDAAKGQNIKFFEKFSPLLAQNGIIIVDNLNFHGLVNENSEDLSRNVRQLVKKINKFKEYMDENSDYTLQIDNRGDGIGIIRRRNHE